LPGFFGDQAGPQYLLGLGPDEDQALASQMLRLVGAGTTHGISHPLASKTSGIDDPAKNLTFDFG
jgi:hypothetical protein